MKKLIILATALVSLMVTQAQLITVEAGSNLVVQNGAVLHADGMTLSPAADFTLSGNALTKSSSVIHSSANTHIARVYQFTNNTALYNGAIQINYNDGSELNSIPENRLTLDIYNGSAWTFYPANTRDAVNNYVLTNSVSPVVLNEISLGDLAGPVASNWLSFTASRERQTAILKWTTAQQQNTRSFTVQYSNDGRTWLNLEILPAGSQTTGSYSFTHTRPANGINYYRLLKTDYDNSSSLSDLRTLRFTGKEEPFIITGNPVINKLIVQVNTNSILAVYSAEGKVLYQELTNPGVITIDISNYPKGVYYLTTGNYSQQFIRQ